jgi:MoaA/NifB/PqqE/SkfB family radical SAM enzyme
LKVGKLATLCSRFVRSGGEIRFAVVQVTTRCNAKCIDRCNIWDMDCTEWCVFETEQEAKDYLEEQYGDDDDE